MMILGWLSAAISVTRTFVRGKLRKTAFIKLDTDTAISEHYSQETYKYSGINEDSISYVTT